MSNNSKLYAELEKDIKDAYETGVTVDDAERLAAKFLHAQLQVGNELRAVDLDARMKKTGVKAIKAAVYLDGAKKGEKKPSDVMLEAQVNMSELVIGEQNDLDRAETERDQLQNYLNVFHEAHVYFRGIAKGRFE
jgi:hypothetical protein